MKFWEQEFECSQMPGKAVITEFSLRQFSNLKISGSGDVRRFVGDMLTPNPLMSSSDNGSYGHPVLLNP